MCNLLFFIDNKEITDPMEIANHFCDFFTNIGPNLAKMIPSSTSSFRSFLSGSFINSIFLEPTTELEISEICASFRAETSAGFDQVTMDVVKQTIDLIIGPLTHILNLSLRSGIVPEQMKVARVILLFKVHLTPKFFFAKIIRLIFWSNLAQKFFDLVKSSNFYAPSKPSFRWFATA